MPEDNPQFDPRLAQGIAYFEQMLLVMPDDRQALEFLCVAYEQVGEPEKRRQALVSLAGVLLKEGDLDSAERIGERLAGYETADAQEMVQKIKIARNPSLVPAETPEAPSAPAAPVDTASPKGYLPSTTDMDPALRQAAIKAEANLVQSLAHAHVIDDAATGFALQQLTEYTSAPGLFLISALAILEKENSAVGEAAAAYVADTAGTPPVPIEAFTLKEDLLRLIPERLVRMRGVLPFARLQDAVLVASLNPLDADLRREIESFVGGPCIHYLAPPRALEELLERVFQERESALANEASAKEGA